VTDAALHRRRANSPLSELLSTPRTPAPAMAAASLRSRPASTWDGYVDPNGVRRFVEQWLKHALHPECEAWWTEGASDETDTEHDQELLLFIPAALHRAGGDWNERLRARFPGHIGYADEGVDDGLLVVTSIGEQY
jgi:hypothetical protein